MRAKGMRLRFCWFLGARMSRAVARLRALPLSCVASRGRAEVCLVLRPLTRAPQGCLSCGFSGFADFQRTVNRGEGVAAVAFLIL